MINFTLVTTRAQLNGNINAICDISKNSIKQVTSNENNAQNTMSLSLPINGSKKRPTCTVPAEHSQARQAADESCEFKQILFSSFVEQGKTYH